MAYRPHRHARIGTPGPDRARQNGLRGEGQRLYYVVRNHEIRNVRQFNTGVTNVLATAVTFTNGQQSTFYWLSFESVKRIVESEQAK